MVMSTSTDSDDGSNSRPAAASAPPAASAKAPPAAKVPAKPKASRKRSPAAAGGKKTRRGSPKTTRLEAGTGLRRFSTKVCRKVESKGLTTYNEVADELVQEILAERDAVGDTSKMDAKNIRRRVYDALNVLMAMDIITKDKRKRISWKGLPSNAHHDLEILNREKLTLQEQVERKRESLRELLIQQVCFRNLEQHNKRRQIFPENQIPLPFIVCTTNASAVVQCETNHDRTHVVFDFDMPFEINDDNTILKRLGMDKTTKSVLVGMVPQDLLRYCEEHNLLEGVLIEEESSLPAGSILAATSNQHTPPPAVAICPSLRPDGG